MKTHLFLIGFFHEVKQDCCFFIFDMKNDHVSFSDLHAAKKENGSI